MKKCSMCKQQFPEAALKKMVHIVGNKAYLDIFCPVCQTVASNNPNYYYLVEK